MTRISLLINVLIFTFITTSCSQSGVSTAKEETEFSTFTSKYLTMEYPTSWTIMFCECIGYMFIRK